VRLILIAVLLFLFGCGGGEANRLKDVHRAAIENVHRAAVAVKTAAETRGGYGEYGLLVARFAYEIDVAKESGPVPEDYEKALQYYRTAGEVWETIIRAELLDDPMKRADVARCKNGLREFWTDTGRLLDLAKRNER